VIKMFVIKDLISQCIHLIMVVMIRRSKYIPSSSKMKMVTLSFARNVASTSALFEVGTLNKTSRSSESSLLES